MTIKEIKKELRFLKIKGGRIDNLQINLDYETYAPEKKYPVLLFTPDMELVGKKRKKTKQTRYIDDHYHIQLTKKQAVKLRDWLSIYIKTGK